MKVLKIIRNLVGITLISVLFYFALIHLEESFIYSMVVPMAGMTINQWIDKFRHMALIGIGVAWLAALSWYVSAQWFFKVNSFKEAGKRVVWALHFLFPVIAIVITILLIPKAQEGSYLSYFILFINGILSYYLSTLLFSPSSFKYAPPLARVFRRW
jgi:hypothetical protein